MKWLKGLVAGLMAMPFVLLMILILFGSSSPHSHGEIMAHAQRLNEAAAIQIPHHFLMADDARVANLPLLKKVESGAPLSVIESTAYRELFQNTLFNSQSFLSRFDGELTILPDVMLQQKNNVGSNGIKGHHDHHDVSARRNYADVEQGLAQLKSASGPFAFLSRIVAINLVQKSLADIISHMGVAPQTISISYVGPERPWNEKTIGSTFESMMRAYKLSQFRPVNGTKYWKHVDEAVAKYAKLVEQVQARLWQNSSWWELRIAGRFLDTQTLAPPIADDITLRR